MSGPRNPIPDRVAARAATRFRIEGEHHISTYSVASHGYAQVGWSESGKTRMTTAHRAAWAHYEGDPGEDVVDHRSEVCRERRCIRREHLRRLSNLENSRRHSGRDWPLGTCRHGHDNALWWRPKSSALGKGYCHACRMAYQRRRRARLRQAQAEPVTACT